MAGEPFGHCPHLPDGVREIFTHLCQDVASLHEVWQLFLDLFNDAESANVLSYVAHRAFNVIHEALGNDLAMAICRLSDEPTMLRNVNLSLAAFVQPFEQIDGLASLVKEFQVQCEPVRFYRHKKIAHKDRDAALNPNDNPIPGVEHARINRILEQAAIILNTVSETTGGVTLGFRTLSIGNGKDLVYSLKVARQVEEQRQGLCQ